MTKTGGVHPSIQLSGLPTLKFFRTAEAVERGLSVRVPASLDAGFDLPSLNDITLLPGGFALLQTGVHLAIPEGWVGLVRDRSGMALRGAVTVAGVIDASYRGEVKIAMHNFGKEPLHIKSGDRIAQCVVVPHLTAEHAEEALSLEDLGDTERGQKGFGSSGV